MEVRESSPSVFKTLMVGPLGGDVRDPEAPITNLEDIDGRPPGR
jgi:hypothetical protein